MLSSALVNAQGETFWDKVAEITGRIIAGRVEVPEAPTQAEPTTDVIAGAAGDTYTRARIAQISINSATSNIGVIENDSGRDRIITRVFAWIDGTDNVEGTTTHDGLALHVATSSEDDATGTLGYIADLDFGTSTEPIYLDTSTSTGSANADYRYWGSSTQLIFNTGDRLESTTSDIDGVVGVEYFYDNE